MTPSIAEDIVYPPGVRELSEDISTDDLVRRLKECAMAFQNMSQEDEIPQRYEPLAHLLISERFLEHKSCDVRLIVACCIADIFRIYAPDAPYKDEYQIKMILEFFIDQLKGLIIPNNPVFKQHFYLLENLSVVKTFNICFDLQDSQKIVCRLFRLMFRVITDNQFLKLRRIILDLLCPLINEADLVSGDLVNIIFNHIVEPLKSLNKNACSLAQEILRKTASSIGTYVQAHFTNEFYLGQPNVSKRTFSLIYELHTINQSMMAFVIPQLEDKLKCSDEKERLMVTELVARMFSDKKSNMIEENKSLWASFLTRFNDISVNVRLLCVKYADKFLLHHPESKEEITEMLKQRHRDTDEEVRFQVISTIFNAAKEDITCINEDILFYIKERVLDKKFRIRKESLSGLARLYKQYILESKYVDPNTEKLLSFVKNKVLHSYYQATTDDKLAVERILHTCLVPYRTPMEKKMRLLYHFYCTVDHHAARAFKEILRNQKLLRTHTNGLLEIIQQKRQEKEKLLKPRICAIAKHLLEPKKSAESISKFCKDLENNIKLRSMMSLLLNGNISCTEADKKVKECLRFLGEPLLTNYYYVSIKQLLERIVPVMLDKESVKYLINIVKNSIVGDRAIEAELKLENSGQRGMELINAIANLYPHYFVDEEIFSNFALILRPGRDTRINEMALETLSYISKDLENIYPQVYRTLQPILEQFIETGSCREAKYAVYSVHKMVNDKELVFGGIIERLRVQFQMSSRHFRTALISIGHIAFLCHDMFAAQFKYIVAQTVVREMLTVDHGSPRTGTDLWCSFDALPEETKIKIEGMKVMVRWLSGLKDMVEATTSTYKLLNAVLLHRGDLIQENVLCPAEKSWMRLSAASCFLKLCRETKYLDCLAVPFFLYLAYVMRDPTPEVREHFSFKINKGLYFMKLPLEFIAILGLGGLDANREFRAKIKQNLIQNMAKRREYVKENNITSDELLRQWPDYALPVLVYLLAHAPFFKVYNDLASLYKIKECLQIFIEAIIFKNESYSFGFFKRLLENIKQTKDKLHPHSERGNLKLYAVSDLALNILMSRPNFVLKEFPGQPKLNTKFFTKSDKNYSNVVTYLPPELLDTKNLGKSGFDIQIFDKTKEKGASEKISNASTSQEKLLPPILQTDIVSSTTDVESIPSTSKTPAASDSTTQVDSTTSTHSNSSESESKSQTNMSSHSSDASLNSTGSSENKLSETSTPSGTNSQTPSNSDAVSENKEKSKTCNSPNFVATLNNGDINHSGPISDLPNMERDIDTFLENNKRKRKSENMLISKKKRTVGNRKSTRSLLKHDIPSSLCSDYSKLDGVHPSSPSTTSVDSLYPSDYENFIKPCYVVLERLEDFPPEILNRNRNGNVSLKRKHDYVDSDDFFSAEGSSAGNHSSEEGPRKRGRPPKNANKTNQKLTKLPANNRKTASTSTSSRSNSKTVMKNGRLPKEKSQKSEKKSKVFIEPSSYSKIKLREELTAEINEIYNAPKISTKTKKSKLANGQQNEKMDGITTGRQR